MNECRVIRLNEHLHPKDVDTFVVTSYNRKCGYGVWDFHKPYLLAFYGHLSVISPIDCYVGFYFSDCHVPLATRLCLDLTLCRVSPSKRKSRTDFHCIQPMLLWKEFSTSFVKVVAFVFIVQLETDSSFYL